MWMTTSFHQIYFSALQLLLQVDNGFKQMDNRVIVGMGVNVQRKHTMDKKDVTVQK